MRSCPFVVRVALALCVAAPVYAQGSSSGGTPSPAAPSGTAGVTPASGGLGRIKDLFSAAAFVDCAAEARRVLAPGSPQRPPDPASLDKVRSYLAACLVLSGDVDAGQQAFEDGIRGARNEQRTFPRPNTLVFPSDVVNAYDQVYGRLEQEFRGADEEAKKKASLELEQLRQVEAAERTRQAQIGELASRETVITQNRRWVATIPFGVGQFQNRKPTLGWIFAVTELAALGVTVGAAAYMLELYSQSQQSGVDSDQLNRNLGAAFTTLTISSWSFLGLASAGIVEALVDFVPEFREVRRRPLPPALRPRPSPQPARVGWSLEPLPVRSAGGGVALSLHF